MPPRKSSSKTASKRKAHVVSDSSIEILDSQDAPPSPPKKKLATTKTTTVGADRPVYEAFPSSSSSITSQLDAIFGASTATGSSRVKVKSEKLKLLLDSQSESEAECDNPPSSAVEAESEVTASPSTRLRKIVLSSPAVPSPKNARLTTSVATPVVSAQPLDSPTKTNPKRRIPVRKVSTPVIESSDSDSDFPEYPLPELFNNVLSGSATATVLKLRTPTMINYLEMQLVSAPMNAEAVDVSVAGSDEERDASILLRGLTFERSDFYTNTSRADPALLGVHSHRLVMANTTTNMHTGGSSNKPYITHKVSILPFAQEFRWDTTVWGQVLNFQRIVAPVSEDGISFHTRPKVFGSEPGTSAPSTPEKRQNGIYMTVTNSSSSTSQTKSSGSARTYPGSCAFEDDIPIYDGNLQTFPLYRGGRSDITVEALVAIGYTLNLYGEKVQLSTNIQFLILLAVLI
ncbi:hypothetical protein BD779DRAFT_1681801 [Infundibulicybe gibba]|nr:hypothetical protein BD779DRAFT_1681801 [Infundibulicybe gibba]